MMFGMRTGVPRTRPAGPRTRGSNGMLGVIVFLALLGLGNGAAKGESAGTVAIGWCILFAIACLVLPAGSAAAHPWRVRSPAARAPLAQQTVTGDPLGAVRAGPLSMAAASTSARPATGGGAMRGRSGRCCCSGRRGRARRAAVIIPTLLVAHRPGGRRRRPNRTSPARPSRLASR